MTTSIEGDEVPVVPDWIVRFEGDEDAERAVLENDLQPLP
jgi:hypothetical protein